MHTVVLDPHHLQQHVISSSWRRTTFTELFPWCSHAAVHLCVSRSGQGLTQPAHGTFVIYQGDCVEVLISHWSPLLSLYISTGQRQLIDHLPGGQHKLDSLPCLWSHPDSCFIVYLDYIIDGVDQINDCLYSWNYSQNHKSHYGVPTGYSKWLFEGVNWSICMSYSCIISWI